MYRRLASRTDVSANEQRREILREDGAPNSAYAAGTRYAFQPHSTANLWESRLARPDDAAVRALIVVRKKVRDRGPSRTWASLSSTDASPLDLPRG